MIYEVPGCRFDFPSLPALVRFLESERHCSEFLIRVHVPVESIRDIPYPISIRKLFF